MRQKHTSNKPGIVINQWGDFSYLLGKIRVINQATGVPCQRIMKQAMAAEIDRQLEKLPKHWRKWVNGL